MKTTGEIERIKWDYVEKVKIPKDLKRYFWEYQDKAPLEALILRTFQYGDFEEIEKIFKLFPEECYKIAFKYPDIKRGVKFWIKRWKNS